MPSAGPIQLADPRADEARPATITMIAIAAGGLGVLFMLGLARVLPSAEPQQVHQVFPQALHAAATDTSVRPASLPPAADEATEPPPRPPGRPETPKPAGDVATAGVLPTGTSGGEPPTPAAASTAPTPAAKYPSSGRARAAPSAASPARAIAAPGRAPHAIHSTNSGSPTESPARTEQQARAGVTSKRRTKAIFEPGVVAYVRCEGIELRDSRFPCPRDRKLEEHVWHVLAQLVNCTDAGRGSAELRMTLAKSRAQSLDFRSSGAGASLNLRALTKCAGGKLANARTSLKAPHAVVSFRFSLK